MATGMILAGFNDHFLKKVTSGIVGTSFASNPRKERDLSFNGKPVSQVSSVQSYRKEQVRRYPLQSWKYKRFKYSRRKQVIPSAVV